MQHFIRTSTKNNNIQEKMDVELIEPSDIKKKKVIRKN